MRYNFRNPSFKQKAFIAALAGAAALSAVFLYAPVIVAGKERSYCFSMERQTPSLKAFAERFSELNTTNAALLKRIVNHTASQKQTSELFERLKDYPAEWKKAYDFSRTVPAGEGNPIDNYCSHPQNRIQHFLCEAKPDELPRFEKIIGCSDSEKEFLDGVLTLSGELARGIPLHKASTFIDQKMAAQDDHGSWRVESKKSPIDDSVRVYASAPAQEPIQLPMRESSTPVAMTRCSEGKTEFFINWGEFIGSETTSVLTRVDSEKAKVTTWNISSDYKATFPYPSIPFIKSLLGHKKLYVQVTPHGESPVSATFELDGLQSALLPVREACGW